MTDKKFRGKTYDLLSLEELKELREFIQSNGSLYGSHDGQMRELGEIDKLIEEAKRRK